MKTSLIEQSLYCNAKGTAYFLLLHANVSFAFKQFITGRHALIFWFYIHQRMPFSGVCFDKFTLRNCLTPFFLGRFTWTSCFCIIFLPTSLIHQDWFLQLPSRKQSKERSKLLFFLHTSKRRKHSSKAENTLSSSRYLHSDWSLFLDALKLFLASNNSAFCFTTLPSHMNGSQYLQLTKDPKMYTLRTL